MPSSIMDAVEAICTVCLHSTCGKQVHSLPQDVMGAKSDFANSFVAAVEISKTYLW